MIRMMNPAGRVFTLAGDGRPGYRDGDGSTARFNYPSGLALDANGNIYVADQGNHRIRIIRPSGDVSTLAGDGMGSYSDGTGAHASFNFPSSVAVDQAGRVFVADSYNNLIRRITPSGTVTTLAGDGHGSFRDGKNAGAQFNHPYGIAVDLAGNVLVADTYNNRIRKVGPDGHVTTLAGAGLRACSDGDPATAAFNYPTGLVSDAEGNIFIADACNSRIRVLR
jgi:serine/threonine-protein kinase